MVGSAVAVEFGQGVGGGVSFGVGIAVGCEVAVSNGEVSGLSGKTVGMTGFELHATPASNTNSNTNSNITSNLCRIRHLVEAVSKWIYDATTHRHSRVFVAGIQRPHPHQTSIVSLDARLQRSGMTNPQSKGKLLWM
jgi:hypothetical protein